MFLDYKSKPYKSLYSIKRDIHFYYVQIKVMVLFGHKINEIGKIKKKLGGEWVRENA